MKRFEQAISHPYGYLVRDLKSGTPEKDRLHNEIIEKRNLTDEKMSVVEETDDDVVIDDDDDDDDNDDDDGDDDDKLVKKSDLPPGRPEQQELTDHSTWLANRATQKDCILRELVIHKDFPQLDDDAKEHYPDCDPKLVKRKMLKEMLPEIRKMAREYLRDQLASIYHLERSPLYRSLLYRSSQLSIPLAITEAIYVSINGNWTKS